MLWRLELGVVIAAAPVRWSSHFTTMFQGCQDFGCLLHWLPRHCGESRLVCPGAEPCGLPLSPKYAGRAWVPGKACDACSQVPVSLLLVCNEILSSDGQKLTYLWIIYSCVILRWNEDWFETGRSVKWNNIFSTFLQMRMTVFCIIGFWSTR